MPVDLRTPDVAGLGTVLSVLADWQRDEVPVQLHSGDLAWNWRFGAGATAAVVRTWSRAGVVLAVGFVDSPGVVRIAVSPDAADDRQLADRMVADLSDRSADLLPGDDAVVEARFGGALRGRLRDAGWTEDEPWTPLVADLGEPSEDPGLRVEVVTPDLVPARTAVQRAAFDRSTFTDDRWRSLASGPGYADARCLVAFDDAGNAVAATTVWSAGPGRRGLIEPLGVHRDHRGRGHGRAMTLAAAAALRELGASSVSVATRSANAAAVATYASAGLVRQPDVPDFRRPRAS
jgi:ribosomal protein S18 acetylase RimI-like enzyme